jgi:hypothetical protein
MAKFCINCTHYKRAPMEDGRQARMVPICLHPEFQHPVIGQPLVCDVVRQEEKMCGFQGKGFVQAPKEDDPPRIVTT